MSHKRPSNCRQRSYLQKIIHCLQEWHRPFTNYLGRNAGKYVFMANTVDVNPSKHNKQGVQKLSSLDAWLKEVITLGKFPNFLSAHIQCLICHAIQGVQKQVTDPMSVQGHNSAAISEKLTWTSPTACSSSSLLDRTQPHPTGPCSPGMLPSPADHKQ